MENGKPKPQRTNDPDWSLFKKSVFNDSCGVCGKPESEVGPLQKGHIHRHAKGGYDDWDNRLPICEDCNEHHRRSETKPHCRPDDWVERFSLAWLHRYRPKFLCNTKQSLCYIIPGTQPTENSRVINWDDANLALYGIPFTQTSRLTFTEAKSLVRELVYSAKRVAPTLPGPGGPVQEEMVRIATHHAEAFKRVAKKFVELAPWDFPAYQGVAVLHIWAKEFVDNFEFYDDYDRRVAAEQAAEAERVRRASERATQQIRLRFRWDQFLLPIRYRESTFLLKPEAMAWFDEVERRKNDPMTSITDADVARSEQWAAQCREHNKLEHEQQERDKEILRKRKSALDSAAVSYCSPLSHEQKMKLRAKIMQCTTVEEVDALEPALLAERDEMLIWAKIAAEVRERDEEYMRENGVPEAESLADVLGVPVTLDSDLGDADDEGEQEND